MEKKHIAKMQSNPEMRDVYAQSGRIHSVRKSLVVVTNLIKREVHFEVTVNYGEPSCHLHLEDAINEYNRH